MQDKRDLFGKFGLSRIPWVIKVYLVLLVAFVALLFVSGLPRVSPDVPHLASDGLKMILGALLGSLSQAGKPHPPSKGRSGEKS